MYFDVKRPPRAHAGHISEHLKAHVLRRTSQEIATVRGRCAAELSLAVWVCIECAIESQDLPRKCFHQKYS